MKYKKFTEAISGTELVGYMGPGYGDVRLKNKNINPYDLTVIYSDVNNKLYTYDDYFKLYHLYLINGGKPIYEINLKNFNKIIRFLIKKRIIE